MHQHPIQHAGAALFSVTFISFLSQWSPVVTWALGFVGFAWYGVLFYDRFINNRHSSEID